MLKLGKSWKLLEHQKECPKLNQFDTNVDWWRHQATKKLQETEWSLQISAPFLGYLAAMTRLRMFGRLGRTSGGGGGGGVLLWAGSQQILLVSNEESLHPLNTLTIQQGGEYMILWVVSLAEPLMHETKSWKYNKDKKKKMSEMSNHSLKGWDSLTILCFNRIVFRGKPTSCCPSLIRIRTLLTPTKKKMYNFSKMLAISELEAVWLLRLKKRVGQSRYPYSRFDNWMISLLSASFPVNYIAKDQ